MTDVNVDYTKNDFLYYKYAFDSSGKEMYNCSSRSSKIKSGALNATCNNMKNKTTPGPCSQKFTDNLCNNKRYADRLLSQKVAHSGSDELYQNTTAQYNIERLSFVNLGIGIIMSGIFISKYNLSKA
jgi:hypothetical protein